MDTLRRSSLTWKLTRIVVGVALLFGIVLNFLQIVLDFKSEEEKAARIVSRLSTHPCQQQQISPLSWTDLELKSLFMVF